MNAGPDPLYLIHRYQAARHACGDWGLLQAPDRQLKEEALRHGGRLVSVYQSCCGQRLYIITEALRDLTTVMLPEEY